MKFAQNLRVDINPLIVLRQLEDEWLKGKADEKYAYINKNGQWVVWVEFINQQKSGGEQFIREATNEERKMHEAFRLLEEFVKEIK